MLEAAPLLVIGTLVSGRYGTLAPKIGSLGAVTWQPWRRILAASAPSEDCSGTLCYCFSTAQGAVCRADPCFCPSLGPEPAPLLAAVYHVSLSYRTLYEPASVQCTMRMHVEIECCMQWGGEYYI